MIVTAEIPREPGHVPLAIVEWAGHHWVVTEMDSASGVTVLQRTVPEGRTSPAARVVARRSFVSDGWLVACCAVFLFLALCASVGTALTFGDVVGCILGFLVLVAIFTRRAP